MVTGRVDVLENFECICWVGKWVEILKDKERKINLWKMQATKQGQPRLHWNFERFLKTKAGERSLERKKKTTN